MLLGGKYLIPTPRSKLPGALSDPKDEPSKQQVTYTIQYTGGNQKVRQKGRKKESSIVPYKEEYGIPLPTLSLYFRLCPKILKSRK
jgi:hypothetical protein